MSPVHWFLPRWFNFITHDGFISWLWPVGTVVLRIMKDSESNKKVKSWGLRSQAWIQWKEPSAEWLHPCHVYADRISCWEAVGPWKITCHQCFTKLSPACTLSKFHSSAQLQPSVCKLLGFSHAPHALTIQFSKHILNTCYLGCVCKASVHRYSAYYSF